MQKRIVLPESDDVRTLKAAEIVTKEGIADVILLAIRMRFSTGHKG